MNHEAAKVAKEAGGGLQGGHRDAETRRNRRDSYLRFLTPFSLQVADLNGDGVVGLDDQNIISVSWSKGTPPNDPSVSYPTLQSARHFKFVKLSGIDPGTTLNDVGHQGLFHDEEFGSNGGLIQNRARALHLRLGRFNQHDPNGTPISFVNTSNTVGLGTSKGSSIFSTTTDRYMDGMSLYQYVRSNSITGRDSSGECECGPDITKPLQSVLQRIDSDWRTWSTSLRQQKCGEDNPFYIWPLYIRSGGAWSAAGWDLKPLNSGTAREPGCGTGERCEQTAWVNGSCHHQRAINYILWGKINKLCGESRSRMHSFTAAWKAVLYGTIRPSAHSWANAGYDGRLTANASSLEDRDCLECGKQYTGSISYIWAP